MKLVEGRVCHAEALETFSSMLCLIIKKDFLALWLITQYSIMMKIMVMMKSTSTKNGDGNHDDGNLDDDEEDDGDDNDDDDDDDGGGGDWCDHSYDDNIMS